MIPVFFPFTYLPAPALHALNACVGKIALYQPSRKEVPAPLRLAEAEGRLFLRYPEERVEEELLRRLEALREWGTLHQGEPRDFERLRPEEIPYTSQDPGFQIRDELRRKPSEDAPRKEEALLASLLFLAIAQEHDQTRESLLGDMARIRRMETALFRDTLLTEDAPLRVPQTKEIPVPDDPPMLQKRTFAWATLFQHHTSPEEPSSPFLFITSHPECLAPFLASADRVLTISGIPENSPEPATFRAEILGLLRNFEENPSLPPATLPAPHDGGTFTLTLYRVAMPPGGPLSFPFSFGNKIAFMGLFGKEEKEVKALDA